MGRRLTTSLHDDDACKAIPDDMPEFCSDLDEHIPVICLLMARKAQAKTQTDPARKLPSSMTRLYELAMNEFEVTKLGTRPNVVTLLELLDARESKVNDYPGDNGWDILIRMLVSGVPPLDNQRYSGTFSVKIDDASRMISLLTRMDKLRLSSARQRLKLLAAATFNCRLG